MDLKDQVVNLELSKRLNELEVEQDSLFFWVITLTTDYHISYVEGDKKLLPLERNDFYSAFTVAELGLLLPDKKVSSGMEQGKFNCIYGLNDSGDDMPDSEWENDEFYEFGYICMTDNTEADVRAKMLIYLIENNFVKVQKKEETSRNEKI